MLEITEYDYEIAEENDIPKGYVQNRVYQLGWTVERAITKPVTKYSKLWEQYKDECEKIGLKRTAFLKRIKKIPPEIACKIPVSTRKGYKLEINCDGHIRELQRG